MTLRDIVLIMFVGNFLFGIIGIIGLGFSPFSLYSLMINGCSILLAYWIRQDSEEIQYLRKQISELMREKELKV